MRAIICGAGIAGLTSAAQLARSGWEVLVVERAPALRDAGYMLDFFGPGYATAERMGLLPALERVRHHVKGIRWIDSAERIRAEIRYETFERFLQGRLMSLMRGDIERVLHDALPNTVEVRFGRTVEAIEDRGDHLQVDVGQGVTESADLLVGADGVHSRVRSLAFGPESAYFHDLGYRAAAFIFEDARIHDALGDKFVALSVPDRQAALYPLGGGRVATLFTHRGNDSAAAPLETLRRVYGDLGWFVPTALDRAAAESPPIYFDAVAQIEMPAWSRGRVVLVGDACQAVSLLAGQGASIAMAASEGLAQELASGTVLEALPRYEARLRKMVTKRQAAGRRMAKWFVPSTPSSLWIRDAVLRTLGSRGLAWMTRRLIIGGDAS